MSGCLDCSDEPKDFVSYNSIERRTPVTSLPEVWTLIALVIRLILYRVCLMPIYRYIGLMWNESRRFVSHRSIWCPRVYLYSEGSFPQRWEINVLHPFRYWAPPLGRPRACYRQPQGLWTYNHGTDAKWLYSLGYDPRNKELRFRERISISIPRNTERKLLHWFVWWL